MAPLPATDTDNRIEITARYVLVDCVALPTTRRAVAVCQAIDAALVDSELRTVLFDSRQLEIPAEKVRVVMWDWAEAAEHHDRIAIVTVSDFWRASANVTALSRNARTRSFPDFSQASAWLL